MQYNFGTAVDAIKQKSWWKWCLILIPYAFISAISSNSQEAIKTIHWVWYLLLLISLFFIPGYLGFLVTSAKKFAHNELDLLNTISFKDLSIQGLKYIAFSMLYSVLLAAALLIALVPMLILALPFALILLAINKILAIVIACLIFAVGYAAILVFVSIFVMSAQTLYIETEDVLSIFKFKEIWYLYNNNKTAIFKGLGWIFLITFLVSIPQMLFVFVGLISPIALGIGVAILMYISSMMCFNIYGQLINHTKIQIEELIHNQ